MLQNLQWQLVWMEPLVRTGKQAAWGVPGASFIGEFSEMGQRKMSWEPS